MKILLSVDGSDCSMVAVDEVTRLPWPTGSELKVFSVAEMPAPVMTAPLPMPGNYFEQWEKALDDQAVANTAKALARFYDGGGSPIDVTTKSARGNAKEAVIDEAERWGADLIIVGTHGYNAFERLWLGSVSRTVVSHAKCSVEIVRRSKAHRKGLSGQGSPAMKILLAVDGSEGSRLAVEEIAERPWPAGSEVRVISAIHLPFTPTLETWALPESYYSEVEKTAREQAESALSSGLTGLSEGNTDREHPLSLSGETAVGHVEEVIIGNAKDWDADLIMLGSHGYRGWERFLLGSTSQAVASHAPCSVQIVRARKNPKNSGGSAEG